MRPNRITIILVRLALAATGAAIFNLAACSATKMLFQGGEKQVRHHLIIYARLNPVLTS